jgi:hypothetical protein
VQDREQLWARLPRESVARAIADTIMLAAYELDAGDRTTESVREAISQASLQAA